MKKVLLAFILFFGGITVYTVLTGPETSLDPAQTTQQKINIENNWSNEGFFQNSMETDNDKIFVEENSQGSWTKTGVDVENFDSVEFTGVGSDRSGEGEYRFQLERTESPVSTEEFNDENSFNSLIDDSRSENWRIENNNLVIGGDQE